MKISKVDVAHPEGSFYVLTVSGEGFGGRVGQCSVWNDDGVWITHVNPVSWSDSEVVLEVSDAEMTADGLMPGEAMLEIVPVPGVMATFNVKSLARKSRATAASE